MADLLVIVALLGFFALCVAFVRGCDRIIGPDDAEELADSLDAVQEPTAASAR